MPKYSYTAKNLKGNEETDFLEAKDKSHLAKLLKEKGWFLISAEEPKEEGAKKELKIPGFESLQNLFGVPLSEKLFFTKNLAVMVKTGVPLPRAFEILGSQTKNKKFNNVLSIIAKKIIKGESLPEAMSSFPKIFPIIFQETLKVGEETGKIEESLNMLANQMSKEHALKSKIKAAMVYPLMVLSFTGLIGAAMLIFAVPKIKAAFEELEITLPITTRSVLYLADFLKEKWFWAILIIIGIIIFSTIALRTKNGKKLKSKLFLSIPLISKITKQANSSLTLMTLSSLLGSGVPIVRSLKITAGALSNFYFKKALNDASELVEKGEKLSVALKPHENILMPMAIQMIEVGEETGETADVLYKLAEFYQEEVDTATQKISSVIEPTLIIIIGGIVGFFALSMMQPMFSIMGGI